MALFSKKTKNQPRQVKSEPARRSNVTSYYRADAQPAASPFVKKTPKKPIRRYMFGVVDIILLAAIIAAILYSMILNNHANVLVSSSAYHDASVYRMAAVTQLSTLKNRNKITFDQQGMAQQLQRQFPEIAAVQTELPLFSERPTIRLTIAPPSFFLSSQGHIYIISANGRAVAAARSLSNIRGLTVLQDQSGYQIIAGQQVLSSSSAKFINTIIAECHRAGVAISSLILPQHAEELDLRTKDQPYYVKFYLDGDAPTQAGQFLAARAHFKQINQLPSQYLDVRVTGKVFYK